MAAYTANQVSISNGDKAVVIESNESPENVSKGDFLYISGSDPKEINRTYVNDNQKHVIELVFAWDSGNKTNQPAIVIPTTVNFRATVDAIQNANLLINDNMQAMSDWQSKLGTVTFVGLDGVERTVPTLASFLATLGTAAARDVGTNTGNIMEVGAFGVGSVTSDVDVINGSGIGSGFFRVQASGSPTGAFNWHTIFLNKVNAAQGAVIQIRDGSDSTIPEAYIRHRSSSGTWADPVNLYHSGNMINPTEYGLGAPERNLTTNIDDPSLGKGFYATIGGENAAAGKFPAGFSKFGSFIHSGYDQLNQLQIYADIFEDKIAFRRLKSDPNETEWGELYHSRNTNFNEFGGGGVGSIVMRGYMRTSGIARFMGEINGIVQPSGISAELLFDVHVGNGVVIAQGVVPIFSSEKSSNRLVVADVPGLNDAGVAADAEVFLVIAQEGAKIKVNY